MRPPAGAAKGEGGNANLWKITFALSKGSTELDRTPYYTPTAWLFALVAPLTPSCRMRHDDPVMGEGF
jgi:hypothetical protein